MENKVNIVASKALMLWPVGILIALVFSGFQDIDWPWTLAGGLFISLAWIFWNVFEYDKYDSIRKEDYLESKHVVRLPKSEDVLDMILEQTKGAFADVILTDKMDDQGYWLFDVERSRWREPAFMKVDFSGQEIVVSLKPKYLPFMPDLATNYRIVNRLKRAAEKLTTTTGHTL
jgi:hypothetical protein